jgi:hypothetical protein
MAGAWSAVAGVLTTLLAFGCAGSAPPPPQSAAQLCAGIPEAEARAGLAGMQPAIDSVEPLTVRIAMGRGFSTREEGATAYIRATPGVTQQWVGRVLQCHRSQYGAGTPGSEADPLTLADVDASVAATETGFAVQIRSKDSGVAKEIVRRAAPLAQAKAATLAQK